jgi:hypothetical protein
MAGTITIQNISEPVSPAPGSLLLYGDSTSGNFCSKDSASNVRVLAQAVSLAANSFLTGLNADGTWSSQAAGYAMWDPLCVDGGNVASATTTNLDTLAGNSGTITGTTTITGITLSQGKIRFMRFSGALTLTNNASIILPGGQSITTVAGDWAIFIGQSGGIVRCVSYQKINVAGSMTKQASGGFGYLTGAGGAVTQATNKSTGVTLNTNCGQITMNNAALAAAAIVGFTLTNSAIGATDNVRVSIATGATNNSYFAFVDATAAGSCHIVVQNISAGSLSEAIVLNFTVIKGVTS